MGVNLLSGLRARRRSFAIIAAALLSGVALQLGTITLLEPRFGHISRQWWRMADPSPADAPPLADSFLPSARKPGEDLEHLRDMVSRTNGYFTRDWSVGLGWNNMRYIIEAALLQSSILNRTLVIPSFVYARSCEYAEEICSAYATRVDRQKVTGWDNWGGTLTNSLAWHIPIGMMLNLPHLRRNHSVVLVSEYLELHGLAPTIESLAGDWDRVKYHEGPLSPTLHVLPNSEYDPRGVLRVDRLPTITSEAESKINAVLLEKLESRQVFEVSEARDALKQAGLGGDDVETDDGLERVLREGGWVPLYTFSSAGGMDFAKAVVSRTKQIAPLSRCRGFFNDYDSITADVVVLQGETHLERKPGQMRFTSAEARDDFARAVLHSVGPIEQVNILADRISERLHEMVGGRMWMAAHMRRGDFVSVGWAQYTTLHEHLDKIKAALEEGRHTLLEMQGVEMFDIPDAIVNTTDRDREKPEENQPFYLATDEHSQSDMQYLRDKGALLIEDLLTVDDRRLIGWPLLLSDMLGVVEQAVLARSSFFVGYYMSSVSGGVINMRAARGADRRTSVLR